MTSPFVNFIYQKKITDNIKCLFILSHKIVLTVCKKSLFS